MVIDTWILYGFQAFSINKVPYTPSKLFTQFFFSTLSLEIANFFSLSKYLLFNKALPCFKCFNSRSPLPFSD
ncbi:hypothetical protein HanIR_Chr04g0175021 [Helianthus annuus]|nr:hypothetical protein HanIR_Chr04g0175021 [Helianthus annuus]